MIDGKRKAREYEATQNANGAGTDDDTAANGFSTWTVMVKKVNGMPVVD